MDAADAEEYTQALGQVCAGGYRQVALGKKLGVPEALGLTTAEWVEDRLGGYVRMGIPERREAVAELTEEGLSGRAISDVLGVDEGTVRNDKKADAEDSAVVEPDVPEGGSAADVVAEDSAVDIWEELADDEDSQVRRAKARQMLSQAAKATSELSASVDSIAEAIIAQGPDQVASDRERVRQNVNVWKRLMRAVDEGALAWSSRN